MTQQVKTNLGIMLYDDDRDTIYASSDNIHNITSALAVHLVDEIFNGTAEKFGFGGILVFETSIDPDLMTLDILRRLPTHKCTYVSVTRRKTLFLAVWYEINADVLRKNFGSNETLQTIADITSRSVKQIREDYKKHGGKWSWLTSHKSRMMFVLRASLVSLAK